jgi:hypothetical protein
VKGEDLYNIRPQLGCRKADRKNKKEDREKIKGKLTLKG